MSTKEKPMLIFNTCARCGACKKIRGPDGKPRDEQNSWNAKFIRDRLLDKNGKLKALRIINIHDSELYPSIDHIIEFTLYHMISSTINITPKFFEELMINPDQFVGQSILRVKLERENDGSINFYVEIDGESNNDKCQEITRQVEEFFLWSFIPYEFSRLRDLFRGKSTEIIDDILPDLGDDPFRDILGKEYNKYVIDPNYYEKQMKVRYGFSWFINFFYPERLREVEAFYPSWLIVSPTEWSKGISDQESVREATMEKRDPSPLRPIYAKALFCDTMMEGNRFKSYKTKTETIDDCLIQYYSGRLFLTYEEVLLNTKGSAAPDIKKYTNSQTGVTYTVVGPSANTNVAVKMAKLVAIKDRQNGNTQKKQIEGAFPL